MKKIDDQVVICGIFIGIGMLSIILFDLALQWYQWTMLAIGGAFRP